MKGAAYMIIIKNREMLIPNNEQYIGTTYDTDTEIRVFKINRIRPGIDISGMTFRLDLRYPASDNYPEEGSDTILLDKVVTDTSILLTWTITESQLQREGTVFIQLRAIDDEATAKWSSFDAPMYVERHLNTPGSYTGDLTEIEQMEQDHQYMLSVVDELKEHIDYTFESEAWATGERDGEEVPETDPAYHNNSKYYKEQTETMNHVSEAYAKGTVDGADVSEGETGYHDNAKYYKEQASASASQAAATVADTNTRFDNAIAAVTTDTELADIRVGADGVTYGSAGTSVRTQITDLKDALRNQISPVYKSSMVNVLSGITWELGFINSSGVNVTSSTFIRTVNYIGIANFTRVSTSVVSGYTYAFYFYNSSYTFISRITSTTYNYSALTIPDGTSYLRIAVADENSGTADISYAQYITVTAGYALLDVVNGHSASISDIENLTSPSVLEGVSWVVGSISASTGNNIDSSTRIRTVGYIDVSDIDEVICNVASGYKYSLFAYDSSKNFVDILVSFATTNQTIAIPSGVAYIRIVFADTSDGTASVGYAEYFTCTYETPLTEMASNYSALSGFINGITPSEYLAIPSYFETNLATAIASIKSYMMALGTDGDAFVFVTDCHWNNNAKHSPALINEIIKKTSVRMVVNGGDYIYAHEDTKEEAYNEIYDCIQAFEFSDSNVVPFNIYGNHDNNTNNNNDATTYLVQSELYDMLLRPNASKVVFGGYNYYYFDNDSAQIRYIFLLWGNNELPAQTAWIAEVMSSLPNGYKAVVFHHGIYGVNSSSEIVITAQFILDAFEDYKDDLICFVQGHAHSDQVYYAYDNNTTVPIILTDTDSLSPLVGDATTGTITEQCFDVMIINTSTQTIQCVRVGRGSSRTISY